MVDHVADYKVYNFRTVSGVHVLQDLRETVNK